MTTTIVEPGVYQIPEDAYHADPIEGGSLSSTGARKLLPPSTPARFAYEREHPPERKQAFDIGAAAHRLVLGVGSDLVVVDAADWRTNAAKEARETAYKAGAIPLLTAEHEQVVAMADALARHPLAMALFRPDAGTPETSLFWQDPSTAVWLRARLDWLPDPSEGRLILVDYKTATSADPDAFSRAVASWGYHQQAAWYLAGVRALGLHEAPAFVFVVQEKDPPYLVSVIELDADALKVGAARNRQAIDIYRACVDADLWWGFGDEVHRVGLPGWADRGEWS